MHSWLNEIFIGLSLTSILLMVALGLAIIYGTMGVINLAHGQFVMIGAYVAWFLQSQFGIGIIVGLPLIFIAGALLGLAVERTIIQRLYTRPLDTILATWGIGIVLEQLVRGLFGSDSRYVARPEFLDGNLILAGVHMSYYRLFIIGFALLTLAVTWFLLFRTEFGTKLRAVIQNKEISECYGVSANRVYAVTFAYGAGLAAIAGALITPMVSVTPTMGTGVVVDAFLVVIVGGVGSIVGTAAAALMIGEATAWLSYLLSETTARILILLGVIVLIRFRPQGLFPDKVRR
ncbi:urea ABC transporter permease subunit UrtB [Marinobacter sp. ELB17]|jgi:urea transport system permease protein|uniref:urea ABC transporter permease subunit UrtB n=1 Tax=Marinobacter sp. ELB17 TaxID=270374 RepID=UPI0000F3609D|nr:urea ABC transporter permease subunit UrtB [Marinobacter sp. ELB17]EAZ97355.1 Branched-chain amino acid ABC-type transport system, permease component [Marinobacter sp. ELB17]